MRTVVLTPELIDLINAHWDDLDCDPNDLFPGVDQAIAELNTRTGAANDDEGFAAWQYGIDKKGRFFVTADQPHYVRGKKKSFWFDGKEFK